MVELYGPSFLSAYGESPSPLWLAAISELTDDECRIGLTALAKEAREYPANLTQFVAACRPVKQVRYLGVPTTPERLALENPKRNVPREFIDKHLAEMRRALGRTKPVADAPACTCHGLGECAVCREWSKRMMELRHDTAREDSEVARRGQHFDATAGA